MREVTVCPELASLIDLLGGTLPPHEQAQLTTHLDACESCRHTIEGLARADAPWTGGKPLFEAGSVVSENALHEAMEKLKMSPIPSETPSERADGSEASLDFLAPPSKPGQLGQLGPYEVTEIIGRGGMGIVLKAFHPALHRFVAIKVLAPQLATSATARKRFTREAQAAAAVSHDHVVTIHAVDEAGGLPYLVMQYISGVSLEQRIEHAGPLELKEILRIGMQVASGLAAAHDQGLIHRDIKPANILLENGVERVKITDFGLARAVDDASLTQSGVVAGTPQFMSPEQASGGAVDYHTDLFSLGSVLYAMCTGRAPFRADNSMAVLRRICDETPRAVHEVNQDIPQWLSQIVSKLHSKKPADRFQSAADVAQLLGRNLAEVQGAQPPDPSPRSCGSHAPSQAGVQRYSAHRWKIVAAGIVCLLAGTGLSEATGVTRVAQWVGTVLRIRTPHGTLVVEVDDPKVQVTLEGEEIALTQEGVGQVRLRPGSYRLQAVRGGAAVKTQLVTIERDRKEIVRVSLEPQAIARPEINLLRNSGFEQPLDAAGFEPAYWLAQPHYVMGKPQAQCRRDTGHKFAGEASLAVVRDQFSLAETGFFQNISGMVRRESMTLRGYVQTKNVDGKVFLAVRFIDRAGTFVDEVRTPPLHGTNDWQSIEIGVSSPETPCKAILALVLEGKGSAWFDDIELVSHSPERTAVASAQAPDARTTTLEPGQNLLRLADFEATFAELQTAWLPAGHGLPGISMQTDSAVKHGGNSSVTIVNTGPSLETYGWRQDIFENIPIGRLLRLTGQIRTKNCVFAGVCVQLLDKSGDLIGLPTTQGKLDLSGTRDWTPFQISFYVPPGTADIAVLGMISGQGQVWFDDFELVLDNAPPTESPATDM